MYKKIGFGGALLSVFIAGCGDGSSGSHPFEGAPHSGQAKDLPSNTKAVAIPNDVTFTVINEDIVPGLKRGLDVRLNKKVSTEVLRSIAADLRAADPNHYKRTFIGYYLPNMQVDAGYWATSHYNPSLEIRIFGLTVEEEMALQKKDPKKSSRQMIGAWLDERPFVGSRVSIFQEDGQLFMETKYKDGSLGRNELVETASPIGRKFQERGDSTAGDHWLLDSNGDLQLRDNEGLISTARKVD